LNATRKSVTWTESAANHLQDKAGTDAAVPFIIIKGDMHGVNTYPYVLGVNIA
jgi:hypothetical protein